MSTTADSVLPDWSLRLISEIDAADRRAEALQKDSALFNSTGSPGKVRGV